MKNTIETMLDAYVHDNKHEIGDQNVADNILANSYANDNGYYWFLTDDEITEFENNPELKAKHIKEIEEYVLANYNYCL